MQSAIENKETTIYTAKRFATALLDSTADLGVDEDYLGELGAKAVEFTTSGSPGDLALALSELLLEQEPAFIDAQLASSTIQPSDEQERGGAEMVVALSEFVDKHYLFMLAMVFLLGSREPLNRAIDRLIKFGIKVEKGKLEMDIKFQKTRKQLLESKKSD